MRKIIFILAILISGIGIWIYPYIAELRDQGLTADMAYDYFFSGQIIHLIQTMLLIN